MAQNKGKPGKQPPLPQPIHGSVYAGRKVTPEQAAKAKQNDGGSFVRAQPATSGEESHTPTPAAPGATPDVLAAIVGRLDRLETLSAAQNEEDGFNAEAVVDMRERLEVMAKEQAAALAEMRE